METPTLFAMFFWLCVVFAAYVYVGYPAIVWIGVRLWARPVRRSNAVGGRHPPNFPKSVSVIITAHNEEKMIGRRLTEFLDRFEACGLTGEVIVVSDGSTDGTVDRVRKFTELSGAVPVRLIVLRTNVGKAAALSAGFAAATSEIIALADARQTWSPDALVRLLENFADPMVGAVSGELKVESGTGVMHGVGLYWKYEKWLRQREALLHSTIGLTGAICAVRRNLFRPIPAGTLLDDVYWPLSVAMRGHRVVFDDRAKALDRFPKLVASEFRRKVRTLSGNFQLIVRLPEALLPWRNPVWFPLVSHKLARLAVPWALLAAFVSSAALGGVWYGTLFAVQLAGLLVALAGLSPAVATRSRVVASAAALLVLNAAAWWAFWVWATGRASRSWTKTTCYTPSRPIEQAAARHEPELSLVGAR